MNVATMSAPAEEEMESAFDEFEGDNFEASSDGKFENPSQTKTAFNEG